ncbi:MAG: heterodisulfide reductase-related iron-sulfur binding cluster [Candidatus Borkfalkiaceae bacterium]|nr:heterodisulfide reductase-related iron-sulfur binding cluster [Christensenellaceae bacterium]
MKICYYPGCTLKTQGKKLDEYARKSAAALGVEMEEIDGWQCCGAVYPAARDEIATKLSAVRALDYAKHNGGKLLTLCSACHNVIKRVNADMQSDDDVKLKANNYLKLNEPYAGETQVIHYLEMLRDVVGFDEIKKRVKNPINKKIGAYYGCLLLRPSKVMAFDNPESPTILEDFIKAIGGTPAVYPMRNECCGAYVALKDGDQAVRQSEKIIKDAAIYGAETIVTACPLCLYNLQNAVNDVKRRNAENEQNGVSEKIIGGNVEIAYFTELLATALGVKQ